MASTGFPSGKSFVFPSTNDVCGEVPGKGRTPAELTLTSALSSATRRGSPSVDGFDPPAVVAPPNAVPREGFQATGGAFINGYLVGLTSGLWTISFPYALNYVVLRIIKAGARATEARIEVYDAVGLPPPADSAPLWLVTIAANVVSAVTDLRRSGRKVSGAIVPNTGLVVETGSANWSFSPNTPYAAVVFQFPFYRVPRLLYGVNVYTLSATQILVPDNGVTSKWLIED